MVISARRQTAGALADELRRLHAEGPSSRKGMIRRWRAARLARRLADADMGEVLRLYFDHNARAA
jgi:hypothetical protein